MCADTGGGKQETRRQHPTRHGRTRVYFPAMRITLLGALVALAACGGSDQSKGAASAPPAAPALTAPDPQKLAAAAPDTFRVVLTTSQGEVEVLVHRAWAPVGADRFYYLVSNGFFAGARFFRVLPGFVAQFGLSGNPAVDGAWDKLTMPDDPVKTKNTTGTLVFATAGANTRTTQLFINLADNAQLDDMGFAPFGEVVRGMPAVEKLYAGYGEGAPMGAGPDQGKIKTDGNTYLTALFPELDSIETAALVTAARAATASPAASAPATKKP